MKEKYVLNIHLENPEPKLFDDFCNLVEKINKISKVKPIVSITPSQLKEVSGSHHNKVMFSGGQKEVLKQMYEDGCFEIAQQGYKHHCVFCFDEEKNEPKTYKDPFHEFHCLYNIIPVRVQLAAIRNGKEILTELLGNPEILAPPNHLYNATTSDLLKGEDFKYITDLSWVSKFPFQHYSDMMVLPESRGDKGKKKHRCSNLIYMHNDLIDMDLIMEILPGLVSLENYLKDSPRSDQDFFKRNRSYKHAYKCGRDLARLPKYLLNKLIR